MTAVFGTAPPAMADEVRDAQWHLRFLNVAEAHRITKGAGVTVAVIDTGVDPGHRDLAGSVLPGADFAIVKVGKQDGHTDEDGHGTGMAGLIAGHGENGNGALGIAPEVKILPIRNMNAVGHTSATDRAITWAVERKAQVINMSFGGGDYDEFDGAVAAAQRANVVLVAAVGNRPIANRVDYPAALPGVIAAAGVDRTGNHAAVSVTGPEVVLAAPAVDILSTAKRGGSGYRKGTGTSGASAIISGAAALVRAKYPNLSAAEVVHRLTATATDKGPPGRDPQYGYGVLNLVAALTADVPPLPAAASPTVPAPPEITGPPMAAPPPTEDVNGRSSTGPLIIGLGCALLTATLITAGWYLFRRRRTATSHHPG